MDRGTRSFLLKNIKPQKITTFTCVVVLGGIIFIFLLGYVAFGEYTEARSRSSLLHASLIFRHGDKTPTSTYPTDPYQDPSYWPEGWGQLTKKGKQQLYQLGQFLKLRYGEFAGPYSATTVRVDSSDVDRCHQSAGVLLAAMFPPSADQVWNQELLWQPIPIHSAARQLDQLITVTAPCPAYNAAKRASDREFAAKYDQVNADLYKYLSDNAGQPISSIFDVETLFNVLEIEKDSGKQLPSWTDSVYPDKMKDIAALVLASFTDTITMKRFKGGPLIKDMISNMLAVSDKTSKRKMSLYAAHDITIVNVKRALGFDDVTFKPKLGAALILELHLINYEPQIQILYLDSYIAGVGGLQQWQIPGCPAPCSLSSFVQAMVTVTPSNWTAECYAA